MYKRQVGDRPGQYDDVLGRLLDLPQPLEIADRGRNVFDADAEQGGYRDRKQLGELLQRLDLGDLAFLETVERGAGNAEAVCDLVRAQTGAEAEGLEPIADVVEANGHAGRVSCGMSRRFRRLSPQSLRGIERRDDDVLVAGAAAEIARDRDPYLLLGRVRIVAQEFEQGRQHAWRAEAALQAVVLVESLLQRVQFGGRRGDALDREDLVAVRLHREHQAGARGIPVEQDGAGAAHAVLAAQMRTREAELVPHEIRERHTDLDLFLVALAVDGQRDLALFTHGCL